MKQSDDKERNVTVEKIIRLLAPLGRQVQSPRSMEDFLEQEKNASGSKSEEDYQKEQQEWLKTVKSRKK